MALKLFIGSASTCSLASHLALEEAGAEYTTVRLNMVAGEHKQPDYLKINPKARVPALITPQGTITETPAILFYIAQTHPAANLAPLADAYALARMQELNAYLCSTVHPNHAHGSRGARWTDDPAVIEGLKLKVPQNMTDNFLIIQNDYLKGPWVMGDQFTVADCYLYVVSSWLESDRADMAKLPRILEHRARVAQRPAARAVLARYA